VEKTDLLVVIVMAAGGFLGSRQVGRKSRLSTAHIHTLQLMVCFSGSIGCEKGPFAFVCERCVKKPVPTCSQSWQFGGGFDDRQVGKRAVYKSMGASHGKSLTLGHVENGVKKPGPASCVGLSLLHLADQLL
jgi:hypothetical protein